MAEAVILDNGSGTCKAGFAGDGTPRVLLPAVLAWPKVPGMQAGLAKDRRGGFAIGSEAEVDDIVADGSTVLRHPIDHGVVTNWESMEKIWRRAFEGLGVERGGHPILVTEAPLSAKAHREQMVQLLFEEFDATSVHVAVSGALSLYATGCRTGLVVEVGDGVSQMVPICEGYIVPHAVQRLDLGGRDLTDYLVRLLYEERGYNLESVAARRAARVLKEQHCYVAQHFKSELASAADHPDQEITFQLPDGKAIVAAGSERFRCPEALFQPSLLGKEAPGIHELTSQAITKCDVDAQRGLAANIVLAGGTMELQGVRERMLKELSQLLPPSMLTRATLPESPRDASFVGGSILASLTDVQNSWVTRLQYEEHGASVIHARGSCLTDLGGSSGL